MTGTGESMGDKIRKGVGLVHGTGETIRGNFNATVDSAAGDRTSAARHENVAERGLDEMQHGHYHGTGAGVTPVDTDRERQNRALQGEYTSHTGSTNHGPHATNIGNKADPRVDSDLDHRGVGTGLGAGTGTTGTTGLETGTTHGTTHGSTNYGPHSSNIGNKADPRVDSDLDGRGTMGTSTTTTSTTGPHSSNLSNKLAGAQDTTTTTGTVPPTSNFASSLEHGNTHHGTTHDSTNHGPHSSNLANKLDPRVDSDRDNRAAGTGAGTGRMHQGNVDSLVEAGENHRGPRVGFTSGPGTGTGLEEAHGQGRVDSLVDGRTAGTAGTAATGTTHSSTNYGPHDSNIANKADPRVDSDRDHRGTTTHGTAYTGSTNYGPHDSNIGNKVDPRVDSDRDHRGTTIHTHNTTHTGTTNPRVDEVTGAGTHSTNHGPHDSNIGNKADPRVDSDLDGRGKTSATNGPHSSKIANVLDPRVDTKTGTWK